eukprot:3516351-Prymnesium_polylepis.1
MFRPPGGTHDIPLVCHFTLSDAAYFRQGTRRPHVLGCVQRLSRRLAGDAGGLGTPLPERALATQR